MLDIPCYSVKMSWVSRFQKSKLLSSAEKRIFLYLILAAKKGFISGLEMNGS